MMKLTDSQLILLSKAAEREDGAAVVPDQMKKAAATKVGSSLVARKQMREIRAKPAMSIWREDEEGRRLSLSSREPVAMRSALRMREARLSRPLPRGRIRSLRIPSVRHRAGCRGLVPSRRCSSRCCRRTRA
jgi:hypothetical protein